MDGKSILIGIAISVAFSMIYHDKFEGKIKQIILIISHIYNS